MHSSFIFVFSGTMLDSLGNFGVIIIVIFCKFCDIQMLMRPFFHQIMEPPVGSCVLFELYKKHDPYVKVFFKNSTETKLPPLDIPNCGPECPLYKFYKLYADILPTGSFDDACKLQKGEREPVFPKSLAGFQIFTG